MAQSGRADINRRLVERDEDSDEEVDTNARRQKRANNARANASPSPEPAPKKQESIPICGIFKMKYYRQYFQATTEEVIKKLFWAIFFISDKFNSVSPEKTDLYGPMWIYCTMVLSLTVSQNLYALWTRPEGSHFVYTIGYVPNAFAVVYAFGLLLPVLFNFVLRMFGCNVRYSRVDSKLISEYYDLWILADHQCALSPHMCLPFCHAAVFCDYIRGCPLISFSILHIQQVP